MLRFHRTALESREQSEMRSLHFSSPATAPPLDDDDLLAEILLRLPPQPSSLPRVSVVCKRWRSLVSDPGFSRRFRRHHRRNPPLLGCFMRGCYGLHFEPTMDPPNRLPQSRFPFPIDADDRSFTLLGCRHGFLLMLHTFQGTLELLVWDPVSGHKHPIAAPRGFGVKNQINGAVLRTALGVGDIQNFQVVLVSTDVEQQAIACVYSSETAVWGNRITTPLPPNVSSFSPAMVDRRVSIVLVGNSLYVSFLGKSSSIIEFDVGRQSLAVIPLPVRLDPNFSRFFSVMRAEGGGLGLLSMSKSDCSAQLWKRNTDCDGVASWVLGRTIDLDKLLSLHLENYQDLEILGFAEENNVVVLRVYGGVGVFTIQLDSLQFKKLTGINLHCWHPFENVYDAGNIMRSVTMLG
uniref:Uncharacterized protein n=1 Tax=Avena sativa TaxID=4498 RepID=A0ACD5Z3B3_AVESA